MFKEMKVDVICCQVLRLELRSVFYFYLCY